MLSATPSSKRGGWFSLTLLRKNMGRFWPLWALYALCLFFSLPMRIIDLNARGVLTYDETLFSSFDMVERAIERVRWQLESCHTNAAIWAVAFGACFGLALAMCLFSYLMNHRSCQLLHALPLRREGIFITNYVTALGFFAIPQLLCFLLSLALEGPAGMLGLSALGLLRWLGVSLLSGMFFFSLATFCAMFTGHILALPVFYGILNVLVTGVGYLVDSALDQLLVGYTFGTVSTQPFFGWCTPAYHIIANVGRWDLWGFLTILGYTLLVGGALTGAALWVYRARKLERAGDIVTVGWVRPIFRYGVGVCTGMLLGLMLYAEFFGRSGEWTYIALTVVFAVVGAFVGQMFLQKTVRVLRSGWKGSLALGLVALVLLSGARLDLFGYQHWTPDPAQVERVAIRGVSSTPHDGGNFLNYTTDDPEEIAAVVAIHAAMVKDIDTLEYQGDVYPVTAPSAVAYPEGGSAVDTEEVDPSLKIQTLTTNTVTLTYEMKDGRKVERQYRRATFRASDLSDPASYAALLQAFIDRPTVQTASYCEWTLNEGETAQPTSAYVYVSGKETEYELDYDQTQRLWAAFTGDLQAGRVRHWLMEGVESWQNATQVTIRFNVNLNRINEKTGERYVDNNSVRVTLQRSATETIEVLKTLPAWDAVAGELE